MFTKSFNCFGIFLLPVICLPKTLLENLPKNNKQKCALSSNLTLTVFLGEYFFPITYLTSRPDSGGSCGREDSEAGRYVFAL